MRRSTTILALTLFCFAPSVFPQTGFPPFASIERTGFDARNDQNMNVNFALPIVSSPGRGMSLNLALTYNSLTWVINGGAWSPTRIPNGRGFNLDWGWTASPTGQTSYQYNSTRTRCGFVDGVGTYTYIYTYSNYIYVDPYGTIHTFNIYQQETVNNCTQSDTFQGTYTGYANDVSGLFASIVVDPTNPVITTKSGIAMTNTGQTDTNGNYISSTTQSETDWTDSAGRLALKIIGGNTSTQYKFYDPTGAYQTTTLNFQTLNIKTNFGCGIVEYNNTVVLPVSLVLPNNQTYQFTYEPTPGYSGYITGRLQRVTLPTGGYYEYDYTGANDGINCADGTTLSMNRVVSDGTNTATWNFVRNTSNLTTTITTPRLADTPNANDTVITFNSSGQEISRKIYANSPGSGTPLRTINTTWAANGTPATQITILDDGSTQSEVATTYDSNGLLDSVAEYGLGTGAPGGTFRTTTYTYQTSTNYTDLNILDLVTSKQIKDGSGTVQYRQDIAYDATSGDNQNCPAGVPQHHDSYNCTFYYRGNPTSVTTYTSPSVPSGGIAKNFTYDWFGNLLTAQLNCCQNKSWAFSTATNYSLPDSVTSGTSPSLTTSFTYNSYTGQVATSTDPNSLVTNLSYDFLRRPTQMFEKYNGANVGGSVSYNYDDTHFTATTTATIDSSKSVQQITALDTLGRPNLTTTEDVSNNVISKVSAGYDLAGRAYQTSNPYTGSPSYWTTTALDVLGRPTSVTLPDNSATTYSYSTNAVTVTDPASKQRKSLTDAAGRLVTVYEPDPTNNNSLSLQTSDTYNVLDELTQVTQGSQTRTFAYDALGRLNGATTPESGTVCFGTYSGSTCQANGYDNFDNLLYRTDPRGVLTTYGYDSLNRLQSISYNVGSSGVPATASLNFTYGTSASNFNNGRLITMTDGVGSENYTYNNLGQMTQLQKVISGTTYTTSYAYNLASELTQITYPSGRVVQQSVDAIGRLCEIAPSTTGCGTGASPYATGYGYTTAGQLNGFKYGNGVYASFGFSADRLQLNCLDYSTTNRNGACAHDGTTKFGLNYSFPAAPGNDALISGISDSVDGGRTASYTYDSLYRLITAGTAGSTNYPAWGLKWTYDRYGNPTAETQTAGSPPQYSVSVSPTTNQISGSPYAYDLAGNMTNDGNNTLVYDAENHATSAQNGSNSGAYTYDGNGLRVQRVSVVSGNTITTVSIFSGSKIIAEYDNGAAPSSPSREYIYAGASLLAKIDSTGTKYYHQDHLSNRLVTDSSGNTAAQMGHFPFGETWYNATNDQLVFTTYNRDSESGNDYAQARYYISRLGRFSSADPVGGSAGDPQTLNRYSYARNAPTNLVDPSGLTPKSCLQIKNLLSDPEYVGGPSEGDDSEAQPQSGCFPTGGSGGTCTLNGGDIPCDLIGALAPPEAVSQLPPGVSEVGFMNGQAYFLEFNPDPDVNAFEFSYPYLSDAEVEILGLPEEADPQGGGTIPLTYLKAGVSYLSNFTTKLKKCLEDLKALGLTEQTIQNDAVTVKMVNSLTTPAYRNRMPQGADFAVVPGTSVPTIAYNPFNYWQTTFGDLLGSLVHEYAHIANPGDSGTDAALQKALGLKQGQDTTNISRKLSADCFPNMKEPPK